MASGSFDETIRIWDVNQGKCIRVILAHSDPITSIDFNTDGTILASASYDGLIRIWSIDSGICLKTIVDNDNPPIGSAKFIANGKYLLVSTLDNTIRLWSLQSGKCVKSYRGHLNVKYCLVPTTIIHQENVIILSGSEDGRIYGWDLNSKKLMFKEECFKENSPIISIAVNEKILAISALESPSNTTNITDSVMNIIKLYKLNLDNMEDLSPDNNENRTIENGSC